MAFGYAALIVLVMVSTGQVSVVSRADCPEIVSVEGATWADVRANEEMYAREFDALLGRLDPALSKRFANYAETTDDALRAEITADITGRRDGDALERKIAELSNRHPDPYEKGQILFEGASALDLAQDGERAAKTADEALKLPLWPDQRAQLHHLKGQLVIRDYRRKRDADPSAGEALFLEMRRSLATEYLKGIRVGLDCAFPENLPDLQRPNTLEKHSLPDDPVQRQAMREAAAHRLSVEAKGPKFLRVMCITKTLMEKLESAVVSYYSKNPSNSDELKTLAAEILHDPQEEAKLMEMLKAKLGEQSAP